MLRPSAAATEVSVSPGRTVCWKYETVVVDAVGDGSLVVD
jgi:hypothetical protein